MSVRRKARPKPDRRNPRPPRTYPVPPPQQVTDHAVIRYMERVMDIDVDRLRHNLLRDGRAELIRTIGNGRLYTTDGATLVIVDGKVVSVLRTGDISLGSRVRR